MSPEILPDFIDYTESDNSVRDKGNIPVVINWRGWPKGTTKPFWELSNGNKRKNNGLSTKSKRTKADDSNTNTITRDCFFEKALVSPLVWS